MDQALKKVVDLAPRITQRRLRFIAFARIFAETMDPAQAYRDVYRPATNPKDGDKQLGDKLLKIKYVQERIGEFLKPALLALGVDQTFALRRLLETIDGDLTDYVKQVPSVNERDVASLMSLKEMRDALPLSKRRLIKRYKETFDQYGMLKSREIELESKQPALELLAKIKGWIGGGTELVVNGDTMMRMIDEARKLAVSRSEALRGEFTTSKTFQQLNRPDSVKKLSAPQNETKGNG